MAKKIEKEAVNGLHFIAAQEDHSRNWKSRFDYGVRLGNEHKGKSTITFVTQEGVFEVHTTIWAVTDQAISLKGGVEIPLNSIMDIHF